MIGIFLHRILSWLEHYINQSEPRTRIILFRSAFKCQKRAKRYSVPQQLHWCLHTKWCTSMFAYITLTSALSAQWWCHLRHLRNADKLDTLPHVNREPPVKLNLADAIKSAAFWNWKRRVASRRWWIPRGSSRMKTRPRHLNIALICITGLMSHLETLEKDRAVGGRGGGRRASLSGVQS